MSFPDPVEHAAPPRTTAATAQAGRLTGRPGRRPQAGPAVRVSGQRHHRHRQPAAAEEAVPGPHSRPPGPLPRWPRRATPRWLWGSNRRGGAGGAQTRRVRSVTAQEPRPQGRARSSPGPSWPWTPPGRGTILLSGPHRGLRGAPGPPPSGSQPSSAPRAGSSSAQEADGPAVTTETNPGPALLKGFWIWGQGDTM